MNLAPVDIAGSVQTVVINRRDVDGNSDLAAQAVASVSLDSFVWEPWLVQLDGDLNLAYDLSRGDSDSGSAVRLSGDGTVAILPRSNYPVTLSFGHLDSRVSGDFSGSDFTRDRLHLTARGNFSPSLRGGLSAGWHRTDQTDSGVRSAFDASIDLSQSFTPDEAFLGITSIGFGAGVRSAQFSASDPAEDDNSLDRASFSLTMQSAPWKNVTVDSRSFGFVERFSDGGEAGERVSLQGLGRLQWRPDDLPFIVTGTLRTLYDDIEELENGVRRESSTNLVDGRLVMRWPVDDHLSFNAGIRAGYESIARDEGVQLGETDLETGLRFEAGVIAGVRYRSGVHPVAGGTWRWDGSLQADAGFDSEEGIDTRDFLRLGHQFDRPLGEVLGLHLDLTVSQDGEIRFDTDDVDGAFVAAVSHSLSLGHIGGDRSSNTSLRLFLQDRRNIAGENGEFQAVRFRFGHRVALDRDRRVQADVSVQATREVDEDGDAEHNAAAFGEISYAQREIFGVRNLSFRSALRFNLIDVQTLFGPADRDRIDADLLRNDWRNVIGYHIGRLIAEAELTGFQRDEGLGYLVLLRLRRDFGGD